MEAPECFEPSIKEHATIVFKGPYFEQVMQTLAAHQFTELRPKKCCVVERLEIPEEHRRQGHGHRLLKQIIAAHPKHAVVLSVPFESFEGLKLIRSVQNTFVPLCITWRDDKPEAVFVANHEDTYGWLNDFIRCLCYAAQSTLADQSVRSISILLDIARRRGIVGRKHIEDVTKVLDSSDWERLGAYISPGCHVSLVGDLWPLVCQLTLCGDLTDDLNETIQLTPFQRAAFVGVGLQHKKFSEVGREYQIPTDQIRIQFKLGLAKVRRFAAKKELDIKISDMDTDPYKLNALEVD